MNNTVKNAYAMVLTERGSITFEEDGLVFEINESEEGYMIDLFFPVHTTGNGFMCKEIDGGICTGSALDAIEFMLPTHVPSDGQHG